MFELSGWVESIGDQAFAVHPSLFNGVEEDAILVLPETFPVHSLNSTILHEKWKNNAALMLYLEQGVTLRIDSPTSQLSPLFNTCKPLSLTLFGLCSWQLQRFYEYCLDPRNHAGDVISQSYHRLATQVQPPPDDVFTLLQNEDPWPLCIWLFRSWLSEAGSYVWQKRLNVECQTLSSWDKMKYGLAESIIRAASR